MIRVLLVDDQPLVRAGLRRILRPRAGFEVVGECDDGDQVERAVAATRPDVVVMDVRMKRVEGAEATRRLRARQESTPVLILTTFDEDEVLSASLRAGASGFQLKDAPGTELLKAAKTVAEGGAFLDLAVTHRVLSAFGAQTSPVLRPPDPSLTPREVEVLKLVGRGGKPAPFGTKILVARTVMSVLSVARTVMSVLSVARTVMSVELAAMTEAATRAVQAGCYWP